MKKLPKLCKRVCLVLLLVILIYPLGNQTISQAGTLKENGGDLSAASGIDNFYGWKSIGPGGGGWLTALSFAPPNTILAGCDVGGVYRSRDWGETWQIVNEGLTNYNVTTILVDTVDPNTIWLGTLGGIFKSVDGGDTWSIKRNGFPSIEPYRFSAPISTIAQDSANPHILYAGIGDPHWHRLGAGTIYKSIDGGENWFVVNNELFANLDPSAIVYSIIIDPTNSETVYVSTDKGFYKSHDGGVSWQVKEKGLPHNNARKLVIHPTYPSILYMTIYAAPNQVPWQGGVYKSSDSGESWEPRNNGLSQYVGNPELPDNVLITSNYEQIVIDPANPDVLYVGDYSWTTAGVYKSLDGGLSWLNTVSDASLHPGNFQGTGPMVECLMIIPTDPSILYFGTPMDLFKSGDQGENWWQVYTDESPAGSGYWQGRGLESTSLYDIAVDPTDSNNVYFGFYDIGFQKSVDGGLTYKHTGHDLPFWRLFFKILVDPFSPNILYASTGDRVNSQLVKSEDFGETWFPIGTPGNGRCCIYAMALDPVNALGLSTLYAGSHAEGVFKSEDSGLTWIERNDGFQANRSISSIAVDPTNSQVIYAGVDMQDVPSYLYGGVYRTINGGETWLKVDVGMPNVRALAIDPTNPQHVYAAVRQHIDLFNNLFYPGGVYRSIDGGGSWERVFADAFVNKVEVVINAQDTPIIIAGTADHPYHDESSGHGVFYSTDEGAHWQSMNDGLSMLSVFALESDPNNPGVLFVGTGGGGLFKWDSSYLNYPPSFTSKPVMEARQNFPYFYFITASDPNFLEGDDQIVISVLEKPEWLSLIDYGDGTAMLTGLPPEKGDFVVVLQVTDSHDAYAQQGFVLTVQSNVVYLPLIQKDSP